MGLCEREGVVPKCLCREGDTRSHLAVLKLPPVAPPRPLPRVAIPGGKPCQGSCAKFRLIILERT